MTEKHSEKKRLMILGAGVYQVPLIQRAKEMGVTTIVVSYPGPYPGFSLADIVCEVDNGDPGAVYEAAKRHHIDGICTTGTDVAVRSLGYVCDRLQLPGISYDTGCVLTDKAEMKKMFQRGEVSTAPFQIVHSLEEAAEAAAHIGYPVMVKAVDSAGSRGVIAVHREADLKSAYEEAAHTCHSPHLLVEKHLTGVEIGLDAYMQDGKIALFLPHNKFVRFTDKAGIPAGHAFPFSGSAALTKRLRLELEKAVCASQLRDGAINADIMVCGETPYFLEMGARAGATCIPELISIYCGYDFYQKIIESALGQKPVFCAPRGTPCMAGLLFSECDGRISKLDAHAIQNLNGEKVQIALDYGVGHKVYRPRNGTDRIGQVVMQTENRQDLEKMIQKVNNYVYIDSCGNS